jgi:2-dehydro-3-deoxyglucarate aldolase/4-hydroxy-2-oxoheptanedioate aldolase
METIKQRLENGKPTNIFVMTGMPHPAWVEIAAMHGGFHGVWLDQEHAAITQEKLELMALACKAAGLDCFARIAPTDYAAVMRPMEAGVGGIMLAQIQSRQHAEDVLRWAKFPPDGCRGLNTNNREGHYATVNPAEFLPRANRDRWVAVQIETQGALNDLDEIAQMKGVDHLFVGPADLSAALGVPGDFLHPKCQEALKRVAGATRNASKSWGILCRGREHAQFCRDLGCSLFALATEFGVIHAGFRAIRQSYGDFFDG